MRTRQSCAGEKNERLARLETPQAKTEPGHEVTKRTSSWLTTNRETLREDFRKPRLDDLQLRFLERIVQPKQIDSLRVGVGDCVRGAGIAVSWLTDGAGVQQVLRIVHDVQRSVQRMRTADGLDAAFVERKRHGIMRVSEEAEWPRGRLERSDSVELVEHVRVLVERRPVANLDQIVDGHRSFGKLREPLSVGR